MIHVGIYGGSGYMGGEALRVLLEHPEAEISWITSRSGKPVEYYHRNLYGKDLKFVKPDQVTRCDVVFVALPTGQIMQTAQGILRDGTRIIDLGADFRLKNRQDWEAKYSKKHESWELAGEAVYGITELHREEIRKARLVANPGCYSSAAILGLAPLVSKGMIDNEKIIVDGLSGTTGVGSDLNIASHHPEIANNRAV
jgi:N-acetyl-gamma-glutamyl-phosphate reductase